MKNLAHYKKNQILAVKIIRNNKNATLFEISLKYFFI